MAVDKGGLRYPIEVIDLFTKDFERFRRQVREARRTMGAFRAEAAAFSSESQSISKASREIGRSSKQIAAGQRSLEKSAQTSKKVAQDTAAATEKQISASKKASAATKSVADEEKAQLKRLRDQEIVQRARLKQKKDLAKAEREFRTELKKTRTLQQQATSADPAASQISQADLRRQLGELNQKANELDKLDRAVNGRTQERRSRRIIGRYDQELKDAQTLKEVQALNQRRTQEYDQRRLRDARDFSEKLKQQMEQRYATEDRARKQNEKSAKKSLDRQQRDVTKAQAQFDRLSEKAARGQRLTNKEFFDRLRAQQVVRTGQPLTQDDSRRINAAERRSATIEAAKNAKAEKTVTQQVGKTTAATRSLKGELQKVGGVLGVIGRRMGQTESSANRLSFTFRRLFGILAAFAVARAAITGFRQLVAGAVQFNSKLEQSRLGIASLITAVGEVRDITGQAAGSAQALELAQSEARRQTELLRKEAIQTAATFDQLVETFQVGLAPGLAAGLDIDQVRKFTVQISQAAAAIGLPQNQLAEEIRSLLSGTIQARTTRIATSLGITNEDVKRAKEAGTLFELLQRRFAGFSAAGEKAAQTFQALFTNTADAFKLVIDTGFVDFFKGLKDLLNQVKDSIVSVNQVTEELEVNPNALVAARALGAGLAAATDQARKLVDSLSAGDIVAFAQAVGGVVTFLATAVRTAVTGIVNGIRTLRDVARAVFQSVREEVQRIASGLGIDVKLDAEGFQKALSTIIQISTVLIAIQTTLGVVFGISKGLVSPLLAVLGLVGKLTPLLKLALIPLQAMKAILVFGLGKFILIGAAVVALVIAIQQVAEELGISSLQGETLLKIIGHKLLQAVKFVVAWVKTLANAFVFVGSVVLSTVLAPLEAATYVIGKLIGAVGRFSERISEFRDNLAETGRSAAKATRDAFLEAAKDLKDVYTFDDDPRVQELLAKDKDARSLGQYLKDSIREGYQGLMKDLDDITRENAAEIVDPDQERVVNVLSDKFERLPGYISRAGGAAKRFEDSFKELRREAESLNNELEIQSRLFGSGNDAGIRQAIQTEIQYRKQLKSFDEEASLLQRKRTEEADRFAKIQQRIVDSGYYNPAEVRDYLELLKQEQAAQTNLGFLRARQKALVLDIRKAMADPGKDPTEKQVNALKEVKIALAGQEEAYQRIRAAREEASAQIPQNDRGRLGVLLGSLATSYQTLLGLGRDLEDNTKNREKAEQAVNEVVSRRYQLQADARARELREGSREIQQQIEAQRRLQAALATETDADDKAAKLKNEIEAQRLAADIQLERIAAEKRTVSLRQESGNLSLDEALALQKQYAELSKQEVLLRELNSLEESRNNLALERALREAALRNEGGFFAGAEFGLGNFADQFRSLFDAFANIAEQSMSLISGTISDSLLDAFDPTDNAKTIQERFRDLTRGIIKIILDELVRSAISNFLFNLGFGAVGGTQRIGAAAGAGSNLIGTPAGARGGEIRGYATGGPIRGRTRPSVPRPRGLDPRDKVPIFAQEGEWMMRLSAVKRYGLQAMHAINEGLVDPSALQALAGSFSTRRTTRVAKKVGYAEGGMVATPRPATGASSAPATAQEGSGPQQAIVLFGPEEFERMLAANKSGMIRFMRENKRAAGIQR